MAQRESPARCRPRSGWVVASRRIAELEARLRAETAIQQRNAVLERQVEQRNAQLAASEAHYRALVNQFPEGAVALVGPDLRYLIVGGRMLTLLGIESATLVGRTVLEAWPWPSPAQRAVERYLRVFAGATETFEEICRTQHMVGYVLPVRDEAGAVIAAMSVVRDITEQRQRELALQESEARFRAVWEHVLDGLVVTDADGTIRFANPAFCRIAGYPAEIITGQSFQVLVTERHLPSAQQHYQQRFLGPNAHHTMELLIRRSDGVERWIEAHARVLEQDGQRSGMLSVVRDITERRRAEEDRLELERKLGEAQYLESLGLLAGGLAHDFNNILGGIIGHAELALLDAPSDTSLGQSLETIAQGARRASELVSQVVAYAGRGSQLAHVVQLGSLVDGMSELLRVTVPEAVAVHYMLDEDLPPIEADPAQIRQVVLHLAVNASEAIGAARGAITLSVTHDRLTRLQLDRLMFGGDLPPGSYVRLTVTDTGIGMDPQTAARIFDPFFTTKYLGRGLGLAAVQGIVRSHRGALQVKSMPGKGTSVSVWLPAATRRPASQFELPFFGAALGRRTVLVVDSEEAVRIVSAKFLERIGFTVCAVADAATALELLREGLPDLAGALIDQGLSAMPGEQLANALQAIRPGTPVVLMVRTAAELDIAPPSEGPLVLLRKPFTRQSLRSAVEQAIGEVARGEGTR
ncbi:MAG TPA: PAS domain S-box protein [Roseiflexaceae bacterium]|nr:PAS domain S-box protein [Roseiflexaceae bacterium]